MKKLNVKFKKLDQAAMMPKYAHPTDAGMDLVAISKSIDDYGNVVYGFGIAVEIPQGYVGLLFPRSSNCKHCLTLTNSVGIIDSGYRGEIKAVFSHNLYCVTSRNLWQRLQHFFFGHSKGEILGIVPVTGLDYEIGDRVAQLVILPYPQIQFEEVQTLGATDRGTGGYGSTGK